MTIVNFHVGNEKMLVDLDKKASELMISRSAVIRQAIKSFCEDKQ